MSELEAGRELDALIEERIFGNPVDWEFDEPVVKARRDRYDEWGVLLPYSTDMGAAWDVVEHLRAAGWLYELGATWPEGGHYCSFTRHDEDATYDAVVAYERAMKASSDTAPLAICKAALAALEDAA